MRGDPVFTSGGNPHWAFLEIRTEHSTLYIRFRPFPLPKRPINTYPPFEHLGPDLGVILPTKTSVLSSIQYKLWAKNSYGGYLTDLHGHSLKVNIWICSFSVSFWSRIVLFPVLQKVKKVKHYRRKLSIVYLSRFISCTLMHVPLVFGEFLFRESVISFKWSTYNFKYCHHVSRCKYSSLIKAYHVLYF